MKRKAEDLVGDAAASKKMKVEDVRDELQDVFAFLEPEGLDSDSVNDDSFWKNYYEALLCLINVYVHKFSRQENVSDYKDRIQTKVLPLLQKRKELLDGISAAAVNAGASEELASIICEKMEAHLRVHLAFLVSHKRPEDSPVAISRFDTEEYDLPDSYPEKFIEYMLCQFDLSILSDTFTSNLMSVPTSGHLYISCKHKYESERCSSRYYKGDQFVEKRRRSGKTGVGTGNAFDSGYITEAFDVLDLPPNEDVDYFEGLYNANGEVIETISTEIKDSVIEAVRNLRAFFTEGNCPHMFSDAYYTQHETNGSRGPTFLLYYSNGGDFLSYIYPHKQMFETEYEVDLGYDGQP